ncbi:hypothetical protein OJ997_26130 [Solirubrobacter phytolaccae]|uniref:Secreted protein n=1 Tax=Solirubrobacter phytolaccae TaxID=1404360 RepID=A0A9X3NCY7_9ACTN|nr:hypothetical protein [Solirubrobacter phytolaccae]MDA0183811.1 hypothetical protein [Solirubrobacter phytolaccae]
MFTALRRTLALFAIPTLAVVTVVAPASAATTSTPRVVTAAPAPSATTQGIIMRDGGVCDPIRHMGC